MEERIKEQLKKYNEENGYSIDGIISSLGYKQTETLKNKKMEVVKFTSPTGNTGVLIISDVISPVFYEESREGKRISTMNFGKRMQVNEYINIPSKDLGAIEFGMNLTKPRYMEFYSEAKRRYRYLEDPKHLTGKVLADEVKEVSSDNPLYIISEIKLWGAEIRRSLAPKNNLTK